jgi:hypothetical protein
MPKKRKFQNIETNPSTAESADTRASKSHSVGNKKLRRKVELESENEDDEKKKKEKMEEKLEKSSQEILKSTTSSVCTRSTRLNTTALRLNADNNVNIEVQNKNCKKEKLMLDVKTEDKKDSNMTNMPNRKLTELKKNKNTMVVKSLKKIAVSSVEKDSVDTIIDMVASDYAAPKSKNLKEPKIRLIHKRNRTPLIVVVIRKKINQLSPAAQCMEPLKKLKLKTDERSNTQVDSLVATNVDGISEESNDSDDMKIENKMI